MKLREQIAAALESGPLNVIALSAELQRRAGIRALTNDDLYCGKNGRASKACAGEAQRIQAEVRHKLMARFQVLTDHGYTIHALYRLLVTCPEFEQVDVQVSAGERKRRSPMRCWRNAK